MRRSIALCTAIEVPNGAWCQAQLGLKFGGLGLRSVSLHAAAAFMASLSSSGFGSADYIHLQQAVLAFNSLVSLPNAITVISVLASPTPTQKVLSGMIEDQLFSTSLESKWHEIHIKHRQVRFYSLRRMALAFALIKQMRKLENRSKEACDIGRDLWIASRADYKNDHVIVKYKKLLYNAVIMR